MSNESHKLKISLIPKGELGKARTKVVTWGELVDMISRPRRDERYTDEQYARLSKEQKTKAKDVGSYVPGVFRNGNRNAESLDERSAITLDIDAVDPDDIDRILNGKTDLGEFEWLATTTRSHTVDEERWRFVVPLRHPISPGEYGPLARAVAEMLLPSKTPISAIDPASFRPAQVMFLPSVNRDGSFEVVRNEGRLLDADELEVDGDGFEAHVSHIDPLGITIEEAEDDLDYLRNKEEWRDERAGWIKIGMALKHEFDDDPDAFEVWREFSEPSPHYNLSELKQQWRSFKNDKSEPITWASIRKAANEARYEIDYDEIDREFDGDPAPLKEGELFALFDEMWDRPPRKETCDRPRGLDGVPENILTIPGVLGLAVDHYNQTSVQYQPQFAVQTALALGSVVLGRHWKLDLVGKGSFTSMYFMNLGSTGSGKEFTRTFITAALEECGMLGLIGPDKYASEPGLFSALFDKPRHISIIDEIGMQRAAQNKAPDANAESVTAKLTSIFGNLGGTYIPPSYSMNGKSKAQVEEEKSRVVVRPAVTVVGMSTPTTFFDTLSQTQILDGFMNRLLVVNSRLKKGLSRRSGWKPIPKTLRKWIIDNGLTDDMFDRWEMGIDDDLGANLKESPVEVEAPLTMTLDADATSLEREYEQVFIDLGEAHEKDGLGELFVRSWEIMMKVAMIVARSNGRRRIAADDVRWAFDYVRFYTVEMVEHVKTMMGRSPLSAIAEKLAEGITAAGRKGVRQSDLREIAWGFRKLEKFDRENVIYRLKVDHHIVEQPIKTKGRPSVAYFHEDYAPEKREK